MTNIYSTCGSDPPDSSNTNKERETKSYVFSIVLGFLRSNLINSRELLEMQELSTPSQYMNKLPYKAARLKMTDCLICLQLVVTVQQQVVRRSRDRPDGCSERSIKTRMPCGVFSRLNALKLMVVAEVDRFRLAR